jgi:hypothetical protein
MNYLPELALNFHLPDSAPQEARITDVSPGTWLVSKPFPLVCVAGMYHLSSQEQTP